MEKRNENNEMTEHETQNSLELNVDDYYTKAEVNARLLLKADAEMFDLETYVIQPDPSGHPAWKITLQRVGIGIVTITIHMNNIPATASGSYVDIVSNVPSRFRPASVRYYLCADSNNKERCVGILPSGTIRIFNSQSNGCFGSTTYFV